MEGAEGSGGEPGLLEAVGRGALGKGGLIAALFLAACSSTPASSPSASAPEVIEQAESNPPVGSRMPESGQDQCGAAAMQYLVGKHRNEIPVPVEVVNRRVVCTTCPVTMDYSAYRLNILYNAQTEIVEQVRCG